MTSIGDNASLPSDEKFEYKLFPYKDGDTRREAKSKFCPECSDDNHVSCEMASHRLEATKPHQVQRGAEMTKTSSQTDADTILSLVFCRCDQRRRVEFVCEEHAEAFCSKCKDIHHRKCKISSIKDKSKRFSKDILKSTSSRIDTIAAKVGYLHEQQQEKIKTFSNMENDCKGQIIALREKLHGFVDEISDASLLELKSCALTHTHDFDGILTKIANIKERLYNEKNILQSTMSSADEREVLVADMNAKQKCDDFEKTTAEIENAISVFEMSFDEDKTLSSITDKVTKLGTVLVKLEKMTQNIVPKDLISRIPVEDNAARLSPKDAERMTGSTFMPSGDLLICDRNAKLVKLFDPAFTAVSKLQLPSNPWDVASVKNAQALISMPFIMKLQFIVTRPSMKAKAKQCITLDRKCFGIAVADDRIFVSCSDAPGNGEIRILDMAGNLKKKLGICEDGTTLLVNPLYILHVRESNTVIASEYGKREIVCLTKDGKIQFRYTVPGGGLRGMIVDKDENIYVCDENKNCIYAITEAGTKHETLLEIPPSDGNKPTSISYRSSDDTLIVTCWKTILVYKLKQN